MKCSLRSATNDDRIALERLVFSVLAEYGLTPDPDGTDSDLHNIRQSYDDAGGSFDVLIDSSGQVVGSVGIFPVSASSCELRKMYLAPSVRRLGFGRLLLEHALARAATLGFTRVVLETASVLREAVSLYERYGFRPFAPDHLAARCDMAYYLDLPARQPPANR